MFEETPVRSVVKALPWRLAGEAMSSPNAVYTVRCFLLPS